MFSREEYHKDWNACFAKTVEYLWEQASKCAQQGKTVIFDLGFWTKKDRQRARQKATDLGFMPIIHYISAPDEVLKERIARRKGVIAERNLKNFDTLKKQFEPPEEHEEYIKISSIGDLNGEH